METVKIIHCADLHFDTPFRDLPGAASEKRKEDLRETFGRIIQLCKEEKVSLLLIAGDLFDNGSVMKTTLEYIMGKFKEIPDVKVFICPGNHDPYFLQSFYNVIQWPSNVHIFSNQMEKVMIPELNTCVYGVGFSKSHERASLMSHFCIEDENYIHIMVLHGVVVSRGASSDYNPIPIEEIENSKLDYLALGHRHEFSGIMKSGNTYWAYSGSPEGRGFDETGRKGVILGEVGKGYCNLNFHPTCKRKYFVKRVEISGAKTYEEIALKIHQQIDDSDKDKNLYKIVLEGEIPEDFVINGAVVQQKLEDDFYFVKIIDRTRLQIDYDALVKEFSLKGIFTKKMKEKIEQAKDEEERKYLEEALKIGLRTLDGGEVAIE